MIRGDEMLRLTGRDCENIGSYGFDSPAMEMHVWMRPDENGFVDLKCYYRKCEKPECTILPGDMVHINVSQFGDDYKNRLDESGNIPLNVIWAELRQFEVVEMKTVDAKYEWRPGDYVDRKRAIVILKEKDREFPQNDGQYWVFYDAFGQKYKGVTRVGLSKIGRELTDEKIAAAIERGKIDNYGEYGIGVHLTMAPTYYVQRCWEYYVEKNHYNKNYGRAVAHTTYAFPDTDEKVEAETKLTPLAIIGGLIWGFIPEGYLGVTYLALAIFFSLCVCVMYNGWFIILCIMLIYWGANAKLKTNTKNKIGK